MTAPFVISSSDPALLEKATRIAKEFVQPILDENIIGIVFLGAIARGYFDPSADIDIAIFTKHASEFPIKDKFLKVEDLEIQIWLSDYEREIGDSWDMSKRWTYSQGLLYYDPMKKIAPLLQEKVPLQPDEKKWLMMSGLTLSEWYVNRLTQLWIERGNIVSAHHMVDQGLMYFLDMLFGLNNQLVADMKWRFYCAEKLDRIPGNFQNGFKETMILRSVSLEELERRKQAFMGMWLEMKSIIEAEVEMSFEEMLKIV